MGGFIDDRANGFDFGNKILPEIALGTHLFGEIIKIELIPFLKSPIVWVVFLNRIVGQVNKRILNIIFVTVQLLFFYVIVFGS